jgi:formylglycine-generating enzyme required for sulfatase activity
VDLPGGVKLELVLVPKGTFWMSEGGENAKRQVVIDHDFYIGKYEVTQEQWQAVMGTNPSWHSRTNYGKDQIRGINDTELKQFPVEGVSWEDCQAFLKKLNESNQGRGWQYRLPKESEWEYSCRGGATSKEGCSYHFYFNTPTNSLSSEQANFDGDGPFVRARENKFLERPTKAGSYESNALGLCDMHGNVMEWCDDWFVEGSTRLVRGGSCSDTDSKCQAAHRNWAPPSFRLPTLGLRVVLVPSEK